jgi:3-hydroxybutyrate dehydrogenase
MSRKVALITGSTSGIGLGIAREFAKAGYALAMNGLETNGEEIAASVASAHGVEATFSNANMLDPQQIEQWVRSTEARFGRIDVVVNNAGVQFVSPIDEFPVARWDAIIGINLTSAFHTTRLAWKGMKERGFGRIINISSAHGLRASEFKSAYVASKHGVVGFTKVVALEGAPLGITANAICPGYVRTPLVEGQIKDQAKAHNMTEDEVVEKVMLKKQAIKDFVTLESLGSLAVFLASEHGALITGTAIPVDGGWTAQ